MLVAEAAKRMGIQMEIAVAQSELLAPLGVRALPSTVFVSADGRIVAAATGARDAAFFERRVRELIGE